MLSSLIKYLFSSLQILIYLVNEVHSFAKISFNLNISLKCQAAIKCK